MIDWINEVFSRIFMAATTTKNMDGDKIGGINRLFPYIFKVRLIGKKIKKTNRIFYYILQYTIYLLLIYIIFF
jgi:beta-hydroxylase